MRHSLSSIACSLAAITLFTSSLGALVVPRWIVGPHYNTFEGLRHHFRATDATGNVIPDGPYSMVFSIWDHETAGTMLWSETQTVVTTDGLGSAMLGESVPIPLDIFGVTGGDTLSARYLELSLGGEVLSPRARLLPVPFANVSERVLGDIETSNGELRVSNIGSSGLDGVAIDLRAQDDVGSIEVSPVDPLDSGGVIILVDPDSSSLELRNDFSYTKGVVKTTSSGGSVGVKVEKSEFKWAELQVSDTSADLSVASMGLSGDVASGRLHSSDNGAHLTVSNIGSSGEDGVSITARPDTVEIKLGIEHEDIGMRMHTTDEGAGPGLTILDGSGDSSIFAMNKAELTETLASETTATRVEPHGVYSSSVGPSSQGSHSAVAQLDSIIQSSYHISPSGTDSSVIVVGGGSVRRSVISSDGISITKVEDKATPDLYESLCTGSHSFEQKVTTRKSTLDKDKFEYLTYHVNYATLDSAHYLSTTSAVGSRLTVSNLGSSGVDGVRCDLNVDNNSTSPDSGKAGGLSILNLGSSGQDDISVHMGTSTDLTAPAGPVRRGRLFVGNLSFAGEDGVSIDVGPGATSVFRVGRLTPLPVVQGHQTAVVQGGATTSEFTDPGGAGGGGRILLHADASQSQTTVSTIGAIAGDGVVSTATTSLVTHSVRSGGGAGGSIYVQAENFPQGGRIGVNNNSPVFEVDVVGSICATGGIGCPSDARLKKNVTEIRDALSVIAQLRGVRFDWRNDEFPDRNLPEQNQIGFIAQEVRELVPEAVVEGADGYLALDYGRLTPILVEAIKQQQATIDELRSKAATVDKLTKQVSDLTALVNSVLANSPTADPPLSQDAEDKLSVK